jgi:hypothetical protein
MADKFSEPLCGTVAPHFGEGPVLLVEWIKSPKQQLRQSLEDLGYSVFELGLTLVAAHQTDGCLSHIQKK